MPIDDPRDMNGRTLLITGGTGSFGKAVLRRFLDSGLGEVRIFSRDEQKQQDTRAEFESDKLKFHIGDVRDLSSVRDVTRGVDYIFHAAALKQVPSCEFFPMEAVRTNVLGTENLLSAAIENGVRVAVLLSTDKAVYPVNAMGMSKALAEKVLVAKSRVADASRTVLTATRYGNVLGSRGSVVPLFVDQLLAGKPVTVTDPVMTRFLMSLEESVDLVMHALTHARPGEFFVQKAPAATVGNLAEALRQLLGRSNPVRIIGTRHGEKQYESLISREEMIHAQDLGSYFRIPADARDLNYDRYFIEGRPEIAATDDYTSHNTEQLDIEAIKARLLELPMVQDAVARA